MSRHFAEIENGIVKRVILADTKEWCEENLGGTWVETFTDREDKNYAGKGDVYHNEKDNFSKEKPFESWILNDKCVWEAPIKIPEGSSVEDVKWDEGKQDWVEKEVFLANLEVSNVE